MNTFQINAAGYVITQLCIALGSPDAVIMGGGVGNALYTSDKYCINVLNTEKNINKIFDKSFREAANQFNIEYIYTLASNNRYCLKGDMFRKKIYTYTDIEMKRLTPGEYPTWMLLPNPPDSEKEMGL